MPPARPGDDAPIAPRGAPDRLRPWHALILGLVHGPAELMPVSSSAHVALIPWLAQWPERDLDPELRKALEVAVHAGTAVALLMADRRAGSATLGRLDGRRAALLVGAVGIPGAVGLALERPIERRLGSPAGVAFGLLAGSVAMAYGDRLRSRAGSRPRRRLDQAGARDGVLLGLAQSAALIPGVSRNGATLAMARARGFDRSAAAELSQVIARPVIAGAAAWKTARLSHRPLAPGTPAALAIAAGGAFASTLACAPLMGGGRRGRPLLPFAVYRSALALVVIRRLRDNPAVSDRRRPRP